MTSLTDFAFLGEVITDGVVGPSQRKSVTRIPDPGIGGWFGGKKDISAHETTPPTVDKNENSVVNTLGLPATETTPPTVLDQNENSVVHSLDNHSGLKDLYQASGHFMAYSNPKKLRYVISAPLEKNVIIPNSWSGSAKNLVSNDGLRNCKKLVNPSKGDDRCPYNWEWSQGYCFAPKTYNGPCSKVQFFGIPVYSEYAPVREKIGGSLGGPSSRKDAGVNGIPESNLPAGVKGTAEAFLTANEALKRSTVKTNLSGEAEFDWKVALPSTPYAEEWSMEKKAMFANRCDVQWPCSKSTFDKPDWSCSPSRLIKNSLPSLAEKKQRVKDYFVELRKLDVTEDEENDDDTLNEDEDQGLVDPSQNPFNSVKKTGPSPKDLRKMSGASDQPNLNEEKENSGPKYDYKSVKWCKCPNGWKYNTGENFLRTYPKKGDVNFNAYNIFFNTTDKSRYWCFPPHDLAQRVEACVQPIDPAFFEDEENFNTPRYALLSASEEDGGCNISWRPASRIKMSLLYWKDQIVQQAEKITKARSFLKGTSDLKPKPRKPLMIQLYPDPNKVLTPTAGEQEKQFNDIPPKEAIDNQGEENRTPDNKLIRPWRPPGMAVNGMKGNTIPFISRARKDFIGNGKLPFKSYGVLNQFKLY